MNHTLKTIAVAVELVILACLWGSFAYWYPHFQHTLKFDLFLWSVTMGVTVNSIVLVFHITRWHYGEHNETH